MTKAEQKRAVADELILAAGTMIEFWTEQFESKGLEPPCDAATAAEYVAQWLKRLPGDSWHMCLPDPK